MSVFEKHLLDSTSDLELANITGKEPFYGRENDEHNLDIEFDPFVLTYSKDSTFEDNLSTSSFLKELSRTSSDEISAKLDIILTSSDEV